MQKNFRLWLMLVIGLVFASCNEAGFRSSNRPEKQPAVTETNSQSTPKPTVIDPPAPEPVLPQMRVIAQQWEQVGGPGILDLMVVVDNSRSMKDFQANLSAKMAPLLDSVSDSDWRIAINTTDSRDGCNRALITKGEEDIETRFANAIQAGTSGHVTERGFLQAVSGLKGECLDQPWVRKDSKIAVLIVSDEDNCSDRGKECRNDPWKDQSYLLDYLGSIRDLEQEARIYGIIGHPTKPCRKAYKTGYQYAEAISATKGAWGDICESDYTETLKQISKNIASILKESFALDHQPEPDGIKVLVDGQEMVDGFKIEGKNLTFVTPPAVGSKIEITYKISELEEAGSDKQSAPIEEGSEQSAAP